MSLVHVPFGIEALRGKNLVEENALDKVSGWCQGWGERAQDSAPLSPQDKGKRVVGAATMERQNQHRGGSKMVASRII